MRLGLPGRKRRPAFSLLEVLAGLTLLAFLSMAATGFQGRRMASSLHARQEAMQLNTALRAARTTAVASGQAVRVERVEQVRQGEKCSGYRTVFDAQPTTLLQPDHFFPASTRLNVDWSKQQIVFLPTGSTTQSLTVALHDGESGWAVEVLSALGRATSYRLER
ncbi:MAG: GspH/FimT family pseudopilin [Planctomycetales bacterium]|nr:GspH/FimT family pseudopilin [Planctomycetales bacterium]MCA9242044.1 GspH/FimT family pseudopilin [Planctomycetales bacterium]